MATEERGRVGCKAIVWATYKIDERHGGSITFVGDWRPAGRANWLRAGLGWFWEMSKSSVGVHTAMVSAHSRACNVERYGTEVGDVQQFPA